MFSGCLWLGIFNWGEKSSALTAICFETNLVDYFCFFSWRCLQTSALSIFASKYMYLFQSLCIFPSPAWYTVDYFHIISHLNENHLRQYYGFNLYSKCTSVNIFSANICTHSLMFSFCKACVPGMTIFKSCTPGINIIRSKIALQF